MEATRIEPIDGLRAIAAISVLAAHTQMLPFPQPGQPGVHLFFVLSAFLLTGLFKQSRESYSARGVASFYIRRVFRIFPMLVVFAAAYSIITSSPRFFYDNALAFRAEGHLWSINQELFFYAILPAIVIGFRPLTDRLPIVAAVILVVFAYLANVFINKSLFSLPGNGTQQFVRLAPFFVGMAAAFLAPTIKASVSVTSRLVAEAISLTLLLATVISIALYGSWLLLDLSFGALVIWLSIGPRNAVSDVLGWRPLRIVGMAGYSFYLWHWAPVQLLLLGYSPSVRFLLFLALTSAVAIVSWHLIERPGIRFGAWLANKISAPLKVQANGIFLLPPSEHRLPLV